MIEDNQVADEETVGSALEHGLDTDGFGNDALIPEMAEFRQQAIYLFQVPNQFLDRAGFGEFLDGDVRLQRVHERPLQVGARRWIEVGTVRRLAQG